MKLRMKSTGEIVELPASIAKVLLKMSISKVAVEKVIEKEKNSESIAWG